MTRENAIRELKIFSGTTRIRFSANFWEALNTAIKALEQTRWTPTSEGLPKVADCYAVTRKIGSDLIVDACFFDGTNTWHNDNRINHERNYLTNIVAWMPLPKPYREVEE